MIPNDHLHAFVENPSRTNRDRLIEAFHYLCRRGAQKFVRPGTDRADLAQVAAIGLIKAVNSFDPSMKTPFEAYAWMLIVGELMHYVRDHERLVRLPRSLKILERRYLATVESLESRSGRRATSQEIATELDIALPVVDELRALRGARDIVSLEDAGELLGSDLLDHGRRLSVEERLTLRVAVSELGERERTIVLGLFATGLSQTELARRLGLSQSHVSKLMKRALGKLHAAVA